jgi:hypothetical protein
VNFDRIVYTFLAAACTASCAVQCTVSSDPAVPTEQCEEATSDDTCYEGGE